MHMTTDKCTTDLFARLETNKIRSQNTSGLRSDLRNAGVLLWVKFVKIFKAKFFALLYCHKASWTFSPSKACLTSGSSESKRLFDSGGWLYREEDHNLKLIRWQTKFITFLATFNVPRALHHANVRTKSTNPPSDECVHLYSSSVPSV